VTYDTFASDRIVQVGRFVAVHAVEAVYLEPIVVGIAVPCIASEGAVKPVGGVKGRAATVAAHGVRRTRNAGNSPNQVITVAIHAEGAIGHGIRAVCRDPTIRVVP
jgi:hypothetical protein